MQDVSAFSERLDMSAEEAVDKLRHMLFEVDGVDSSITDEQCDLLIDIDDDPSFADKIRQEKLDAVEKVEKAAAKKKATAEKKAAAAAKKKATAAKKKAATKKKAAVKKKADTSTEAEPQKKAAAKAVKKSAPAVVAEILTDDSDQKAPAIAEILPPDEPETEETIVIGTAIDHEEHRAEIVRADGTHVDVADMEVSPEQLKSEAAAADPEELGLLAQAEKKTKADQQRKQSPKESSTAPDPEVVAEVIRKANEKKSVSKRKTVDRAAQREGTDFVLDGRRVTQTRSKPSAARGSRRTGKTARKRQRKLERMRQEETMRRSAAAAIREYQSGAMDGGPKKRKKKAGSGDEESYIEAGPQVIQVDEGLTVEALAHEMDIDTSDIILELMNFNIMATKNQTLSMDLIRRIAEPQGFVIEAVIPEEEEVMAEEPDAPEDLEPRAPVITVMGHVDHGKTSLLDRVRKASVAEGEAGGITQHIAAYEVNLPQGRAVFLDTPGHQAFTAMRARGAQVTDVVVLVVAADDGIMPQTREAIDHAKAAEVPIVVAVNKCDKPDAQPERIRQELTQYELLDEQWGGKTIIRDISALNGDGVDELMELLVLETQMLELKANPNKPARGAIVESEITRGQGPVAWVLVKGGTLRIGDTFLAGETYGRVRAMQDSAGNSVKEAVPSTAVVVVGFNAPPSAGDQFVVVKDERVARSIAEKRQHQDKIKDGPTIQHVTLEDFHEHLIAGEQGELKIVVKADVQGSVDVLESTLPELGNEEARASIVHAGVGPINESDVLLASASDAVIMGFHVEASPKAEALAQAEGVDIRSYKVIYEMTEDIRKSLEGLLAPEDVEVITGHVEIRQIFKSSALGNIAGCMQIDGETLRDSLVRLQREDEVIYEGKIGSLRREKESVASVQTGFECGITLDKYDGLKEGDVIETYRIDQVAKTLT